MIIFSPLAPEWFQTQIGYGPLYFCHKYKAFNLNSPDTRYPIVSDLMPSHDVMSHEALLHDESKLFEQEYFQYLLTNENAVSALLPILLQEYHDGTALTQIETLHNSPYTDSLVESLCKFFVLVYGLRPIAVYTPEDLELLSVQNSVFHPQGLTLVDAQLQSAMNMCPDILTVEEIP